MAFSEQLKVWRGGASKTIESMASFRVNLPSPCVVGNVSVSGIGSSISFGAEQYLVALFSNFNFAVQMK